MDILYKCKDAFSLKDEIGTCPNMKWKLMLQINLHFLLGLSYVIPWADLWGVMV